MKKSIRTHFALLFTLLALAPIAIIFAIFSPGLIRDLNTRTMEDLQSLGKSQVSITSLWIEEKIEEVKRLANSHHVVDALMGLPQDSDELHDFMHANLRNTGFLGIYVLDREGNLKTSAEIDKYAGLPKEAKQLLKMTQKGTSVTQAGVCRSKGAEDKRLMLCFASPVLAGTDVQGAVVAKIDFTQLSKVLRNMTGRRVAHNFLIDKDGTMLACFMLDPYSPCSTSVGKKLVDLRTGALTLAVQACLTGREGFSPQLYTNHVGKQVVGAWGWLPELEAGILIEINAQDFLGPVSSVKRRLWSLLLIVGLGLVFVSIFVSRRVSEPLISLTETAKRIAAGNLEERSLVKSQDELGELANSLNTMVESMQSKHAKLEEANKKLAAASVRDGLTGLYNHYHFHEMIDAEYRRAKRYALPLCLL
ncbi:MAG: HAMP domain-containing protein, partial [Candidatus Brocadiales bacterium]